MPPTVRGPQRRRERPDTDPSIPAPPLTAVDGAYGVLLLGTFVTYLRLTSGFFFWADDWQLARRGHSFNDYFEPYNEHLTLVPIAIYHVLLGIFGFHTYLPLRLVAIGSVAAISAAMFVLARARIGVPFAAILSVWLLWSPGFALFPGTFNHYLALAATILCAIVLTREGARADIGLAITLTFALCCSGVGAAAAVGCLTYAVLNRSPLRRFVAIAVPTAAWALWWLTRGRTSASDLVKRPTLGQTVHATSSGIVRSFETLAAGNRVLAAIIALLFVANLVWRVSQGARAASNAIAWIAALGAWWVGVAYSRGELVSLVAFRYEYVGAALLVLAFMPPSPVQWSSRALRSPGVAAAVLAVGVLIAFAYHGETFHDAHIQDAYGRLTKQQLVVANLGPAAVPDNVQYTLHLGFVTAGQYRQLVHEYGRPFDTTTTAPDADIIRLGHIRLTPELRPGSVACAARPTVLAVPPDSNVVVRTGAQASRVAVRRFGARFVPLGEVGANSSATITLPGLFSKTRWIVTVERGCLGLL
jgi:hypothetical protein